MLCFIILVSQCFSATITKGAFCLLLTCAGMEIQINRSIKMDRDERSDNDIARHLDPEIVADALRLNVLWIS